jgi:hypothetical protein
MKKQIIKTLIGLSIGVILVIIIKIVQSNKIEIFDFVPLIGFGLYFPYQNFKIIKVKRAIRIVNNIPVDKDSLPIFYHFLTRDFITIQNTSGYQTLKSKGLETIKNDSLRRNIIDLYEVN